MWFIDYSCIYSIRVAVLSMTSLSGKNTANLQVASDSMSLIAAGWGTAERVGKTTLYYMIDAHDMHDL